MTDQITISADLYQTLLRYAGAGIDEALDIAERLVPAEAAGCITANTTDAAIKANVRTNCVPDAMRYRDLLRVRETIINASKNGAA